MDRRHKRKEQTQEAIRAALRRLERGEGRHPRHIGIRVRITKEAVAREAGRSPATIYRFPELLAEISAATGPGEKQRRRPSEQRRKTLLDEIAELERRNAQLIGENLRLTRLLAKHDPTLGEDQPIYLDFRRQQQDIAKAEEALVARPSKRVPAGP